MELSFLIPSAAVRESLVLLKNENALHPISKKSKNILVAATKAQSIDDQSGGWTIEWQGKSGEITPGTTVLEGIEEKISKSSRVTYQEKPSEKLSIFDYSVVVLGETPYAESTGDKEGLSLDAVDQNFIEQVCLATKCVVILLSGRPLLITDLLPKIEALLAAWLPGTADASFVDVIFADENFTGVMPVSWPASMDQIPMNAGDQKYDPLIPYRCCLNYE